MTTTLITAYKATMSQWASGVALITTLDQTGQPQGLLISSLASVSLEPLLVSFALSQKSGLYPLFCQTSYFAVNILADTQQSLAENFVGVGTRWQTLVEGANWQRGPNTGCPILPQSLGVLECAVQQRLPLGDHDMFVGHVLAASAPAENILQSGALAYFARQFMPLPKI